MDYWHSVSSLYLPNITDHYCAIFWSHDINILEQIWGFKWVNWQSIVSEQVGLSCCGRILRKVSVSRVLKSEGSLIDEQCAYMTTDETSNVEDWPRSRWQPIVMSLHFKVTWVVLGPPASVESWWLVCYVQTNCGSSFFNTCNFSCMYILFFQKFV